MGCALIPITFSEIYSIVIFVKYIELQRLDLGYLLSKESRKHTSSQKFGWCSKSCGEHAWAQLAHPRPRVLLKLRNFENNLKHLYICAIWRSTFLSVTFSVQEMLKHLKLERSWTKCWKQALPHPPKFFWLPYLPSPSPLIQSKNWPPWQGEVLGPGDAIAYKNLLEESHRI